MGLKKNAVSYIAWMILLLFTGAACSFFGMIIANIVKINVMLVIAGIVIGFFAVIFLLYYLTGILVARLKKKELSYRTIQLIKVAEPLTVVILLAVGLIVRILLLPMAGEDAEYFELAKVTGNSMQSIHSVQGSVYYYCMLLHGLFRVVGNNWTAGILLQIGLQLVGTLLCYLAVRRMIGKVPALLVAGLILFVPSSVKAGLTYSPQMLYLCIFALCLLIIADYLRHNCEMDEFRPIMWLYTIVAGCVIGICSYVDVSGVLLGLPLVCILTAGGEYRSWLSKGISIFLVYVAARISFGVCIWIDAILCNSSVIRVMDAWKLTYSFSGFHLEWLAQHVQIEVVILVAIACIGCVSFWRRKSTEYFTPCVLMVMGICVLITGGFTIDNMNGGYLLYLLLAMLAAVSITELFYVDATTVVKSYKEVSEEVLQAEADVKKETKEAEAAVTVPVTENKPVEKKVELFENPLPVPKKHVKKTLDYAFIPEPAAMKYDVRVSEQDDYDYK